MKQKNIDQAVIGLIVPTCLKYAPYVQYYIDVLNKKSANYRILSWNKQGMTENNVDFSFDFQVQDADRKRMAIGYIKFIRACKKYIKGNNINKLIVLTAAPAFFMGVQYLKRFAGNYILDIRDDSPFIRKFPKAFQKICNMAQSVVVSSHNFTPWTCRDTILCHNADINQILKYKDVPVKNSCEQPISITFAGMMIEGPINIDMLKRFGKDPRFSFYFIGKPNAQKDNIEQYVRESGMTNVFFEGTYNKNDIVDIYRDRADIVNILRAKSVVNRNALPNKMYDAVISGVPIVVFDHNQAVATYVAQYNLGFLLREEDVELANDVMFEKITAFDYDAFAKGRQAFLNQVCEDMDRFAETVTHFANVDAMR